MNLYAVKKQQKRIAALLAADREASERHATNKQRRDLIKKRMNSIVQVDQYSPINKEYKKKYDESVNFYLKDFYEKNETTGQSSSASQSQSLALSKTPSVNVTVGASAVDSDQTLRGGLPSMPISVNYHKTRNRRASSQKPIQEQVERMHQLRRASRAESIHSDDVILSLISRPNARFPKLKCTYIPEAPRTAIYQALPIKEHMLLLTSDNSLSNGVMVTELDTESKTNTLLSQPHSQPNSTSNQLPIQAQSKTAASSEAALSQNQSHLTEKARSKTDDQKVLASIGSVSPQFRRLQSELRDIKRTKELQARELLKQTGVDPINIDRDQTDWGSSSGPLPTFPSLDLSRTDISSKHLTDVSTALSRSSSAHELNSSLRSYSEFKQKSRSRSLIFYESQLKGKVRRAGKLYTPHSRPSISLSKASSLKELESSSAEQCDCEERLMQPKIYKSCVHCYRTFQHEVWCESSGLVRTLQCETCGGRIRGVLSPPTLFDITEPPFRAAPFPDNEEEDDTNKTAGKGEVAESKNGEPEQSSKVHDEVLMSLPVIRFENNTDWVEKQLDKKTPSETSSKPSADSAINQLEGMLASATEDYLPDTSDSANSHGNSAVRTGQSERPLLEVSHTPNDTGGSILKGVISPAATLKSQDWTKVHEQAYLAAIADIRAKNLPIRPEYLGLRTTRSYTSTYFTKLPWAADLGEKGNDTAKEVKVRDKTPEMKKILGKSTVYDYYPGGKRNHLKNVQPIPKIKASQ